MILTLETGPAALPISVTDVREELNIVGSDSDAKIATKIDEAVSLVDARGALGRAMITQSWAVWVQNPVEVRLFLGPFQSLTSVQYYDAAGDLQTDTLSNYEVIKRGDDVSIRPKSGFTWPTSDDRPDAIKVTYVAGYGDAAADVPPSIRLALKLLVTQFMENYDNPKEQDIPPSVMSFLNIERTRWYG